MKPSGVLVAGAAMLLLAADAFAITSQDCDAAWKSSSAYLTCSPASGAKANGNSCDLRVTCQASISVPACEGGKERLGCRDANNKVLNLGSLTPDDTRRLNNCNGSLKVGGC